MHHNLGLEQGEGNGMNILLCCAAGMSSSLIVTKMEKAAEARGIEVKIWAVSGSEVNSHIDEADVLLLGPQVRYLLPKMKELCKGKEYLLMSFSPSITAFVMGKQSCKQLC